MKRLLLILSLISLFVVPQVHAQDTFKVTKVVDGDTIQVNVRGKKEVVRLLGIDTPESVDPRKPVQCFAKEATSKMKSLVNGKSVILVDDATQGNTDKYKRLLRYVYLPDSVRTFVNGEMVKQGYAFSYKQYPTKMLDKFNNFEMKAREQNIGLWGSCPLNVTPTKTTPKVYTAPKTVPPVSTYIAPPKTNTGGTTSGSTGGSDGAFSCSGKTTCGQMTSCAEARYYLNTCGLSRLDRDKDGTPCETICN
ncbi:MAG TPA: thermonuclease family protein [Candidatus Saccharimonadales bacterium]|nr:thermonuclease family protein [Candidatus Saccharimonadales bacterium]